ncbi:MAG: STAS domain-containing protein, partial [Mycobacterium sp.]
SGMSLRTHFQPDITVVEVRGAVDACNAQRLSDYAADLASAGRRLIVDLYGVDFFGRDGVRAMVKLAEKCQQIGVRWLLVPSEAVSRLLRSTDDTYRLPTAASLNDALQRLTLHNHTELLPQRITPQEVTRC